MVISMPARNVDVEFDALKSDFSKLSSDLASLTEAMRTLTGEEAQGYLDKARNVVGQAQDGIGATVSAISASGHQGIASVEEHIRQRPLASILIGLGVGLAIGRLVSR